jgi:hypothetical protein
MSETILEATPRAEPLFRLDLGSNGGALAPASFAELREWVQKELNFWSTVLRGNPGAHENIVRQWVDHLGNAANHANQAESHQVSNPEHSRQQLQACQTRLNNAFIDCKLPHSSTPQAQRLQDFRQANSDLPLHENAT